MATVHQELDAIMGTTSRVPRLMSSDGFPEWKWTLEQHTKAKEPKVWRSIIRGPTLITYTDANKQLREKDISAYDETDFDKV